MRVSCGIRGNIRTILLQFVVITTIVVVSNGRSLVIGASCHRKYKVGELRDRVIKLLLYLYSVSTLDLKFFICLA